jgi:GT2 family glycosyltransferase
MDDEGLSMGPNISNPLTAVEPLVSVIIPTHNRRDSLLRTLRALSLQQFSLRNLEAIVVADHCRDGTLELLESHTFPFACRCVPNVKRGPSSARNHGASIASGRLLLFLDDDIESMPGLVKAHLKAHERLPGHAIIGPCLPPAGDCPNRYFDLELRSWWSSMMERMRPEGHRFGYTDCLSGNLSIRPELFARAGGFDTSLNVHEDYELGLRIIEGGGHIGFEPDAAAFHHDCSDLSRSLKRKYNEGEADVRIGRMHPRVIASMPLAASPKGLRNVERVLRRIAFYENRAISDCCIRFLKILIAADEKMRLRRIWRRHLHLLLFFSYWRGTADTVGGRTEFRKFLAAAAAPDPKEYAAVREIQLRGGFEAARRQLDRLRGSGAILRHGRHLLGLIPPQPGRERLKGDHLRHYLLNDFSDTLLKTLAMERLSRRGDDE